MSPTTLLGTEASNMAPNLLLGTEALNMAPTTLLRTEAPNMALIPLLRTEAPSMALYVQHCQYMDSGFVNPTPFVHNKIYINMIPMYGRGAFTSPLESESEINYQLTNLDASNEIASCMRSKYNL